MTGATDRLAELSPAARRRLLDLLPIGAREELARRWALHAHGGQGVPEGGWRIWLIRAGRGFGKTRAGAEWVTLVARQNPDAAIALVGASKAEVHKVMIDGPSGLRAVARPGERPVFHATRGELRFPSGAVAHVYSANAPESLRGAEHHAAWCDELAKWRYPAAWDNLVMGLRGGDDPRIVVTTTPRLSKVLNRVLAADGLVVTTGSSRANPHLPAAFVAGLMADYGGTRLGRQEIEGELLDDVEGALWTRAMLADCRVRRVPALARVVVGVDPPATAGGDACGIVAAGLGRDGRAYVLEDASVAGLSPDGWARIVAKVARRWKAERVVAERNMGGDMVAGVLAGADRALPVRLVVASRGKSARAEPVAAAYERGDVKHVAGRAGALDALEDELAGLQVGGGYQGPGRSPDRADACVWALTELLLRRRSAARVRGLG